MERIVNVINEKGEREKRLLFAVDVARNSDRSGVHYNYVDGDGHTYTNKTVAGSVRVVDDRYRGNYAETDTGKHTSTKRTYACMVNLGMVRDKEKREELANWLKSYKRVTDTNGVFVYCNNCTMSTANTIAHHTVDKGLFCMSLDINNQSFKITKDIRQHWNKGVNYMYRYLGV